MDGQENVLDRQQKTIEQEEKENRSKKRRSPGGLSRGFRLGSVAGVEIRVDWSLFVIFWLVLFSLGAGVFASWHPDWSPFLTWSVALGAALLFFGSVLAHELSHALVARTQGIEVRRITLFIFGGMAHMDEEARRPRAELLIAVAGPVTSLVIGIVATLVGGALVDTARVAAEPEKVARAMGPAASLLLWLGPINVLLALFNMVPGFPLDGGRVLRAVLWWRTGDLNRATAWAASAGRVFGWFLMAVGVAMALGLKVPIFGTGLVGGLWLLLIGWFLSNAAMMSYRQFRIDRALSGVSVSEVMRSGVGTIEPDARVQELVDRIMTSEQRCFPVVQPGDGGLGGLACVEDVRRVPREEWDRTPVSQVMTGGDDIETMAPEEEASAALKKLARRDVAQIPVVDQGQLRGMVRREDIMKWIAFRSDRSEDAELGL